MTLRYGLPDHKLTNRKMAVAYRNPETGTYCDPSEYDTLWLTGNWEVVYQWDTER